MLVRFSLTPDERRPQFLVVVFPSLTSEIAAAQIDQTFLTGLDNQHFGVEAAGEYLVFDI